MSFSLFPVKFTLLALTTISNAASASISAPDSVEVNTPITISVSGSGVQWNLVLKVNGTTIGSSQELENYEGNKSISFSGSYTPTEAGTITAVLEGSVTDVDETTITSFGSATITVTSPVSDPTEPPSDPTNPPSDPTEQPTTAPTEDGVTVTEASGTLYLKEDGINMRESYNTNSTVLTTIQKKDTAITVLGTTSNGWTKISYNGYTGYIKSEFLYKKEDNPTASPSASPTSGSSIYDDQTPQHVSNNGDPSKSSATLNDIKISGVTFAPIFNPTILSYVASVGMDVNDLEITVTPSNTNEKYEITGNKDYLSNVMKIVLGGAVNNEAGLAFQSGKWESYGDSIDIAFLALARKAKVNHKNVKKVASIPYESENKYSAVFFENNTNIVCSVKGSLETVFEFCDDMYDGNEIVKLDKEKILIQNEELASQGFRVIAVASNDVSNFRKKEFYDKEDIPKLIFLGLVAFIDPIRKEVKGSIEECHNAGIKVVMVTGDHPLTAFSIANELGIANDFDEVTTGVEIDDELVKGSESFDKFVNQKKVFTRVTPIQKLEIVEAFKRNGEFVAVTGDGVNDAPAIKAANIGIAMGSGSDVAKETSNMIIIDDNFMSIVSGIEEGRNAYANIRKVVFMLVSCGLAEVLFFTLSIAFGLPIPLLAVQLLWLNLVTDGLQDLALSFEKGEKNVMNEPPRSPKQPLFDKLLAQEIIISGLFIGIIVYLVWIFLLKYVHMDESVARGYVMAMMVFMQNMHVLNCRSEKQSAFKIKLFSNWFVPFAIFSSIFLQLLVMEIPFLSTIMKTKSIPVTHMLLLLLASTPIVIIMEIYKLRFKKNK